MNSTRPSPLFFLTFLGMELSYLYLLASLFDWPAYSLVLSLALYPLALLSGLVNTGSKFSRWLKFTLEMALVILAILLVAGERLSGSQSAGQVDVSGIVLGILFCGLIWLLGHTVPQRKINYYNVVFRLQVGLLAVLVLSQIVGQAPPVFVFFLLAPLALFYARWAGAFSRGAVVLRSPNPGHLFLGGASVIVPGTALVLLFSPDIARAIVNWLGNISDVLSDWMMSQHQAAADQGGSKFNLSCNVRPDAGGMTYPDSMAPGVSGDADGISPVIIWIVVSIILLLIITIVFFALRRRKTGHKDRPMEPVQFRIRKISLNTIRGLFSFFPWLLRKLWRWLLSLFRRLKQQPGPPEESLASIRDIYRNVLRWAAKKGTARAASQTPLEHLELLAQKFPGQQDGFKQVTEAYLLARYSRIPISRSEFFRIREIWQSMLSYLDHSHDRGR